MFTTKRPGVSEFLAAYKGAIRSEKDSRADLNEGSRYEQIGGVTAIIWSRLVQRDETLFESTQTDTADGTALTSRLKTRFNVDRVLDGPGTGKAILTRPDATAGGDAFYEGTRIEVVSRLGFSEPQEFEVAADTPVATTATRVVVPIRAVDVSQAVTANAGDDSYPRVSDTIWDPSWVVQSLTCSAGTTFESAPVFRARARTSRKEQRFGQSQSIIAACESAGAQHVVLFPSNFGGDDVDYGLNWVYVGDGSYNATTSLVRACTLALESARVLGDNLQVGAMVQTNLAVAATVQLNIAPAKVNTSSLVQRLKKYIVSSLQQDYTYSLDALRGSLYQASSLVQDVTFTTPLVDAPILTMQNGALNFPTFLPRYSILPDDVNLALVGPG